MLVNMSCVNYGNNVVSGETGRVYLVIDIYKSVTKQKGYTWHGVMYETCETYLYNSMEG